jgi:hypothetical protein
MIKRPPVVHRKRPDDEQEQIRIAKERIDTQLLQDQQSLQPNTDPFLSKQDMIQRLIPFHLFAIRDVDVSSDMVLDLHRTKETVTRACSVLEREQEQDTQVLLGFMERLDQLEEE